VPDQDLESVPNLEETHRNALSRQLEITSLRALADADQRTVYQALRNTKPRPTLARVAEWQSYARSAFSEAPDWQPTASFAVIFAQRRVGDSWERRLEVERTEVEFETAHLEWTGWDCGSLCGWMRGQLGLEEDDLAPSNADGARYAGAGRVETGSPRPVLADRVPLRIDSAVVTDAVHSLDLIKVSGGTAAQPVELTGPIRLATRPCMPTKEYQRHLGILCTPRAALSSIRRSTLIGW